MGYKGHILEDGGNNSIIVTATVAIKTLKG